MSKQSTIKDFYDHSFRARMRRQQQDIQARQTTEARQSVTMYNGGMSPGASVAAAIRGSMLPSTSTRTENDKQEDDGTNSDMHGSSTIITAARCGSKLPATHTLTGKDEVDDRKYDTPGSSIAAARSVSMLPVTRTRTGCDDEHHNENSDSPIYGNSNFSSDIYAVVLDQEYDASQESNTED